MESPTVREHPGEKLFIGGAWVSRGNFLEVTDKFSNRTIAAFPTVDLELVERAALHLPE